MPFDFTELAQKILSAGLVPADELEKAQAGLGERPDDAELMELLVASGRLTKWHVAQLQSGKERGYFLEHYKLMEPIGAGGMGQVFRAIDTELNRQVAVKILPRRSASRSAVERFRREGQAALQVQHEHLVRSFELGQSGETHFLVMELVVGTNLAKYIEKKGKLGVQEAARIGYEVALALDHARELGIIHRDIKPSNILINRKGGVKVADLGLAKFFGQAPGEQRPQTLTHSGAFMGTLDYCAPEQAEDAKRADTRSDIYSLGCTLYHCLTGQPPFPRGTDVQKIVAHREHEPTPVHELNSEVPQSFSDMIHRRMLAKRPDERFQTPAEAATALHRWISGEPGSNDLSLLGSLIEDELGAEAAEHPSTPAAPRRTRQPRSDSSGSPAPATSEGWTWARPGNDAGRVRRRRIEALLIPFGAIAVIGIILGWFFGPWKKSVNVPAQVATKNAEQPLPTKTSPPINDVASLGAKDAELPVDATKDWDVVFSDNFDREGLGDAWRAEDGNWSIQAGAARGVLDPTRSQAELEFVKLQVPDTVQIRVDFWTSADFGFGVSFWHGPGKAFHMVGLTQMQSGIAKHYGRPTAAIIVRDDKGKMSFPLDAQNPQLQYKPIQKNRLVVVQRSDRLTGYLNGKQITSTSISALKAPRLVIKGEGIAGEHVFLDNVEVLVPRGLSAIAKTPSAEPSEASVQPSGTTKTSSDAPAAPASKPRSPLRIVAHSATVYHVAISPDGGAFVTGGGDSVRIWDSDTGQPRGEPMPHPSVGVVAFNSQGTRVLTWSPGMYYLWDSRSGKQIRQEVGLIMTRPSFTTDGKTIWGFVTKQDMSGFVFRSWNVSSKSSRDVALDGRNVYIAYPPAVFSPNGQTFAIGSPVTANAVADPTMVRFFQTSTGKVRGQPLQHDRAVRHARFSGDGTVLATIDEANIIRFWNTNTCMLVSKPIQMSAPLSAWDFRPTDQRMVVFTQNGEVHLIEPGTGLSQTVSNAPEFGIRSACFSADANRLITGYEDGSAKLWDAAVLLAP